MTIYERIYKRLLKLVIDPENIPEYAKSKSGRFMDLNLECLRIESDHIVIALFHFYEQGGDLIPDPDMLIQIYRGTRTAEALTYQDTYAYKEVYPTEGKGNPKAKRELNQFLFTWLTNLI